MTTKQQVVYEMTNENLNSASGDIGSDYAQIAAPTKSHSVDIILNEKKQTIYEHLAQADDDVKLGRVHDMDDAFDDILAELDCLQL